MYVYVCIQTRTYIMQTFSKIHATADYERCVAISAIPAIPAFPAIVARFHSCMVTPHFPSDF